MERNRWDRAIRCLEIALHPNTGVDEVIAGVNGFRRTADGMPLSQICREFARVKPDGQDSIVPRVQWQEKFDSLTRENLDLRRRLKEGEDNQAATAHRLQEAEQRVRELDEELQSAQRRTRLAEEQVAGFQPPPPRSSETTSQENFNFAGALARVARAETGQTLREPIRPFREFLAAASLRARLSDTSTSEHQTNVGLNPRRPWTA